MRSCVESDELRKLICSELFDVGFKFRGNSLVPPNLNSKDALRKAHSVSKKHMLMKNREWILNNEKTCMSHFADGIEICPDAIEPKLVLVDDEEKSRIFRYASYLWSIPLSRGFGRRYRYLVTDKSNDKLIGIFGLTDPVIGLKIRDDWIGWCKGQKEKMLWHVMDLFAFGAVRPYNTLLGGKLIASLATSSEVQKEFKKRYSHGRTRISRRNYKSKREGLALITTTGAFGESSILDRLKGEGERQPWEFVGFTKGWGTFHLNNGIASRVVDYLKETRNPIMYKNRFGDGPNWKIRVIREGLKEFGIDYEKYGKHGIKRGFYAAPLAENFKEFLLGQEKKLKRHNKSSKQLFEFFRTRYLLPRAERIGNWKTFKKEELTISKFLN